MINLLTIFALFSLTACGFTPLHGTQGNDGYAIQSKLAQIDIETIPNREGQYLRNALVDRFYTQGTPSNARYILKVNPIEETTRNLDITKSADATRGQMTLTTSMTLLSLEHKDAPTLKRSLRSTISYNKLAGEFTNIVSENNARENALNDLARQIEMQISLYLKQ